MSHLSMSLEQLAAYQKRLAGGVRVVKLDLSENNKPGPDPAKPKVRTPRARKVRPVKLRESQVMAACQKLLEAHPQVALWFRQNTGAARWGDRYVKFSFRGASDLMAVSTTGRFIAVEVKATGRKATPDQQAFLDNVTIAGGLALCVDDPAQLAKALPLLIGDMLPSEIPF